jgi:hypothetical protein
VEMQVDSFIIKSYGFFDTFIIILFDLASIALLIPVCLASGKRWFNIMCLACITFSFICMDFDRHRHYFNVVE